MSMRILVTKIDWDTDGELPKSLGLPDTVEVNMPDDSDPAYEIADVLSDKFGWCVNSYQWNELT